MRKISRKPFLLFWGIVPFLIVLGLYKNQHTLDLNIHDTYYVISQYYVAIGFALIAGLIGLIYFVLIRIKIKLSNTLNTIHWILTLVGIILLIDIFGLFFSDLFIEKRYYTTTQIPNLNIFYYILMIFIGQIIFLINIIKGFLHRHINK